MTEYEFYVQMAALDKIRREINAKIHDSYTSNNQMDRVISTITAEIRYGESLLEILDCVFKNN